VGKRREGIGGGRKPSWDRPAKRMKREKGKKPKKVSSAFLSSDPRKKKEKGRGQDRLIPNS